MKKKSIIILLAILVVVIVGAIVAVCIFKGCNEDKAIETTGYYKVNGVASLRQGAHVKFEKNTINYLIFMTIADDGFKDKHISSKAQKVLRDNKQFILEDNEYKDAKVVSVDVSVLDYIEPWIKKDDYKYDIKEVDVAIDTDKGLSDEGDGYICEYKEKNGEYYIKSIEIVPDAGQ